MMTNTSTNMTPHEKNLMKQYAVPTPPKHATHAYLLVAKEDNFGKIGRATVTLKRRLDERGQDVSVGW